jgi:hypothetical protein
MPFICTFETCMTPHTLYNSKAAWISHLRTEHARREWICMDPSHTLPESFAEAQGLKSHIRMDHGDESSDEQLNIIADECFGTVPGGTIFAHCPFRCEDGLDDVEDS